MRIWRVGNTRNAVSVHNFVASRLGKAGPSVKNRVSLQSRVLARVVNNSVLQGCHITVPNWGARRFLP